MKLRPRKPTPALGSVREAGMGVRGGGGGDGWGLPCLVCTPGRAPHHPCGADPPPVPRRFPVTLRCKCTGRLVGTESTGRRGGRYCDACDVGFSDLLSWLEGGLLFQGLLAPSAGELLKLSSSSMPLAASNCVFSSRVMSRSSSSPNSPPISVGSPTTITS